MNQLRYSYEYNNIVYILADFSTKLMLASQLVHLQINNSFERKISEGKPLLVFFHYGLN